MLSHLKLFAVILLSLTNVGMSAEHFTENLNLTTYPHKTYGYSYEAEQSGVKLSFSTWKKADSNISEIKAQTQISAMEVKAVCTGEIVVKRSSNTTISGKQLTFNVYDNSLNGGKTYLIFKEKNSSCELTYDDDNVVRKMTLYPYTLNINNLWSSVISANSKESFSNLEDGVDAINKRIEILTGKRVSNDDINARNPKMELDFSVMPKYDFILFTTLQFNNDYVSNIMFKALAEHARRGTPVVVVGNVRLIGDKEQALLDWLQKQSPLIKIINYEYFADTKKLGDKFDRLHRVSHVKVLVTYSKNKPENSHVIFGGRNNSDRYFFPEFQKFDDEQYTQFDKELLNSWAYFHDLEYYVLSDKLAKRILTTMMSYLKFETKESKMYMGSPSDDISFTLSVPFRDQDLLEKEYIDLIDSAQKSIHMLSPYIYYTDKIDQALARAAKRGVYIEAITSASLLGDEMTKSLKGIYDKFSNQRKEYINVYSYVAGKETVMHRKGFLVDEKILMLGSVNLSKRSFYHDIENNLTITNPGIVKSFIEIYNRELKDSEQIVQASKTTLVETLVKLLDQENLL
ncbi:MAG: phosphatidylserine/phosphatidylglycerophosphate/cardiolipin synthase family protein [Bdellovibrionales bacterium]|nr:phosphatidylserine/phosphatidylglycerophosphate/cardiolipin synthase family protein [Bdellovibrionales bacterium]